MEMFLVQEVEVVLGIMLEVMVATQMQEMVEEHTVLFLHLGNLIQEVVEAEVEMLLEVMVVQE
jgi:hypothetical protein